MFPVSIGTVFEWYHVFAFIWHKCRLKVNTSLNGTISPVNKAFTKRKIPVSCVYKVSLSSNWRGCRSSAIDAILKKGLISPTFFKMASVTQWKQHRKFELKLTLGIPPYPPRKNNFTSEFFCGPPCNFLPFYWPILEMIFISN